MKSFEIHENLKWVKSTWNKRIKPTQIGYKLFCEKAQCGEQWTDAQFIKKNVFGFFSGLEQNFEFIPHINQEDIGFYGGSVALADYCPYIQEFTWRSDNVAIRGSNCLYEENNPRKPPRFHRAASVFLSTWT